MNFQMFKLVLEKSKEREIKLPTSAGSSKKQDSSRKTSFFFDDYAKAFDCVDLNKLWKILREIGIPDHLTCLLRNLEVKWSEVKSLSHIRLFATPWIAAYQAPPPVGFSRQEYWSGVPSPFPFSIAVPYNEKDIFLGC